MIMTLGSDSSDSPQPLVERLGEGDRAHRASSVPATAAPASSNPARYAAYSARSASRIAFAPAYTWSNSASGGGSGSARTAARSSRGLRVGLRLDLLEEGAVGLAGAGQVGPDALDRVPQPPGLELARQPVPGGVVGRGVRAHPVGERLDQRRALALAGGAQRLLGHRVAGEHVVAVDLDAGEAEAARPLVDRDPALPLRRRGDRELVVLAEEHDRGVEDRRPGERLAHVALAGGAVAEVGDRRLILGPVALDAHRVPGGVQGLVADDDRVEVELVLLRVPAAVVDAAEDLEQPERVEAAAPGHAVLAVGGERHVPGGERARRSRSARPPGRAASAHRPSSPWRWSATASVSIRRTSTMSRYMPLMSTSPSGYSG